MMAVRIDPTQVAVVGLDLGGTLIKSALVRPDGSVAEVQRRPTRRERGPDAALATIVDVAGERVAQARALGIDVRAVGLASCGLMDETSGIAIFSAALQWRDVPIRATIADRVGLPVAVGHDVRSGALAEARIGAGRGHDIMLFVPIGTGVGGALVIGGRPYAGAHWAGVELGHTVIRPGGTPCACGQSGCLDTLAGGSAIARRYSEMATEKSPTHVEAADVVRLAREGEPVAVTVWTEAIDAVAEALALAVTLLDPSVIVIGGGIGRSGDALHVPLRSALASRLAFQTLPEITAAALGDDAGCIGAGLLAWDLVGAPDTPANQAPRNL
jgi:glucokinase